MFEVLPDLSLDGQCKGVLSLLMQQPGIRVALGRFMVSSTCIGPLCLAPVKACHMKVPGHAHPYVTPEIVQGLLEHFVSTERQLEYAHEGIVHERYLLAEERKKVITTSCLACCILMTA